MAQWEYATVTFTVFKTQNGLQWCWQSANKLYSLIDACDLFGKDGWEMVNLYVDSYELKTKWNNREAMRKVAVFKRPLVS